MNQAQIDRLTAIIDAVSEKKAELITLREEVEDFFRRDDLQAHIDTLTAFIEAAMQTVKLATGEVS